jgi:hypothetical protein
VGYLTQGLQGVAVVALDAVKGLAVVAVGVLHVAYHAKREQGQGPSFFSFH